MKCPYSFPARSRAAMVAAIVAIARPYYDRPQRFAFSWNVKAPWPVPVTASQLAPYAECALDPALDSAWEAECSDSIDRFRWLIEDMQRPFIEGEYCTYPGDDAGAFSFGFYGRQGGHLCLESAFGLRLEHIGDIEEELSDPAQTDFKFLRRLYRALVVMDSDFSREKVREAFAYAWAWQRQQWEEDTKAERARVNAAIAADYEASRPDMYGAAA